MVDSMKELDLSNILTMSIWNSTFFTSANSVRGFLNPESARFHGISSFIHAPLDVIGPEGKIMTHEQCMEKYGRDVPEEILVSVNQAISNIEGSEIPRNLLGYLLPAYKPFNYATITKYKKGCSYWNRFLRRRKTDNIISFENKMATQLGINIDPHRWKQIYWLVANIKYGNDIKWFMHQIIRGCLPTNFWLKKMKIRQCDLCTFCRSSTEIVNHLFWDCREVLVFLNSIKDEADRIASGFDIGFTQNNLYGKEIFILGDNRADTGLEVNYVYNIVKRYIWRTRCKRLDEEEPLRAPTTVLSAAGFFNDLDYRLRRDLVLPRKHSELRFITALAARRGIG